MGYRKVQLGPLEVLLSLDSPQRRARAARRAEGGNAPVIAQPDPPGPGNSLPERIKRIEWYHTIDLGNGNVTPGVFDHRPYLELYKLPASLKGKRVLDCASMDGFWAFQFEKLGAAEVVALDVENFAQIDYPPKARAAIGAEKLQARRTKIGFDLAKEVLGSRVQVEYLSLYDLSPERLGMFDFVFCSDVLLHLTNPVRALQNICRVTRGQAQIAEFYSPVFPGVTLNYEGGRKDCVWWSFSFGCLEEMIRDAGFSSVELLNKFPIGARGQTPWMWHGSFLATP